VEGDGREGTGIAAVCVGGRPVVYFGDGGKVVEVSADGVGVGQGGWKSVDVTG